VQGEKTEYITTYTPSLLESLSRNDKRQALGIAEGALPFRGVDIWNAYEFSWLNNSGRPEVSVAQFHVPCSSANMVESKSLKLYLGSFSQTSFGHRNEVIATIESDLSVATRAPVGVSLFSPEHVLHAGIGVLAGTCLDNLDVEVDEYSWNPDYLEMQNSVVVREALYTNLMQSRCPITGQPDTASVFVQYHGATISHEGLLRYLISYREHAEFSEQIVERIFVDIMNRCSPDRLTVQARFTRRGGIDINPFRSHDENPTTDVRLWRQ
jgi:7-cyano-7-deazaguanine reductase